MSKKQEWIDALRSEKYDQARGRLRSENRYCCLGVMCDIQSPTSWEENWHNDMVWKFNHKSYGGSPPVNILEEFGINVIFAGILATLNDQGFSFDEIARVIEGDYLGFPDHDELVEAVLSGRFTRESKV